MEPATKGGVAVPAVLEQVEPIVHPFEEHRPVVFRVTSTFDSAQHDCECRFAAFGRRGDIDGYGKHVRPVGPFLDDNAAVGDAITELTVRSAGAVS